MKDQLIFNTADADSIAASDSVGAYLRASDGTLLTHTDVGGKKALDVRVAEGINVEVDLSHVDDSVRLGDGTDLITSTLVSGKQGLDVNLINASVEVTATDLDIRALDAAQDSVEARNFDGSGTAITSTLVSAKQGLDVNIINSLTVNDAALADTAIANAAKTLAVADTAEAVVASPLSSRKYLYLYNAGNTKMYIGSGSVSPSNGFPVSPGSYMELRAGASVAVNFIGDSGKQPELRSLELS